MADGPGTHESTPTTAGDGTDGDGPNGRLLLVLALLGVLCLTASTSVIFLGYPILGLLLTITGIAAIAVAIYRLVR